MYKISAGNEFGHALLGLIQDEYETIDDGIFTIAQELGISDADVVEAIESEAIDLDVETFTSIAGLFDATQDENVFEGLAITAMDAIGELDMVTDIIDVYEELVAEDEEALDEEEDEEYVEDNSFSSMDQTSNFSASQTKVRELEARVANFEKYNDFKDALARLTLRAEHGLQEGWLPPIAKQALVANFARDEDRVAEFSKLSRANKVDLDTQLYAIEFALNVFERCGSLVDFNHYSDAEVSAEEMNQKKQLDNQARLNLEAMGLIK